MKAIAKFFRVSVARDKMSLFTLLGLLWFAWLTIPYALAWYWGGWQERHFIGFFFNSMDGFSYLAKMHQGAQGAWCYASPFGLSRTACLPIFLYYLFLGHISHWLALPPLIIFHLARIANGLFVFFVLQRAVQRWLRHSEAQTLGLGLALFGGGLGWIYLPFILPNLPPDFNLADAFLSFNAIGMPHFLLIQALVLLFLSHYLPYIHTDRKIFWRIFVVVGLTSLLSPFAAILMVLTFSIWMGRFRHPTSWRYSFKIWIFGLMYPTALVIRIWLDREWSSWQAQNITLSHPLWQVVLSLVPPLLLAFGTFRKDFPLPLRSLRDALIIWLVLAFCLGYSPIHNQRRFLLALYPIVALLAALGWERLRLQHPIAARWWYRGLWIAGLPTFFLIVAGFAWLLKTTPEAFFLTQAEADALQWIQLQTSSDALWVSHPGTGQRLAGLAGCWVLTGHPMETPWYEQMTHQAKTIVCEQAPAPYPTTYIWFGPSEQEWCNEIVEKSPPIYQNERISIYEAIAEEP